ncbi:MAG: cupin domain-containing protein [bacterium]|nr:cupin domain-containing protein [bacterium]
MKIIHNPANMKKWVLDDGDAPIQLRVVTADEINPVNHLHKTMHEYFYLLKGSMDIDINGTIHHFKKDDLLLVEPGESHCLVDFSSDLKLLLMMPPPIAGDKVELPGATK